MSYEVRAYDRPTTEGWPPEPVVVLVVSGDHDVSRLVNLFAGGSAVIEQLEVGQQMRTRLRRHNQGTAALRLLASHGGPDFSTEPEVTP